MGRYYSGDIEGKFWYGVQDSDDATQFGCEPTEDRRWACCLDRAREGVAQCRFCAGCEECDPQTETWCIEHEGPCDVTVIDEDHIIYEFTANEHLETVRNVLTTLVASVTHFHEDGNDFYPRSGESESEFLNRLRELMGELRGKAGDKSVTALASIELGAKILACLQRQETCRFVCDC